jgi:WD40 repeat protein
MKLMIIILFLVSAPVISQYLNSNNESFLQNRLYLESIMDSNNSAKSKKPMSLIGSGFSNHFRNIDPDPYFGWEGYYGGITCLAYNKQLSVLASGGWDCTIRLWDPNKGSSLGVLIESNSSVNDIEFSPDGKLLASCHADGELLLWNTNNWKIIKRWKIINGTLRTIAFSPDGLLLAGSSFGKINIFNINCDTCIKSFSGYGSDIFALKFLPDGTKLIAGSFKRLDIWDINTNSILSSFNLEGGYVDDIDLQPNGNLFAITSNMDVVLMKTNEKNGIDTVAKFNFMTKKLCFSPDGKKLVTGCYDGIIREWDISNYSLIRSMVAGNSVIYSILYSPDGSKLYSGNDEGKLQYWETNTGNLLCLCQGHTDLIWKIKYFPGGLILGTSGLSDERIFLWNANNGEFLRNFIPHSSYINSFVFSPDGKILATAGGDSKVRLWNANDFKKIIEINTTSTNPDHIIFSSDGTIWAYIDNNKIKILDYKGNLLKTIDDNMNWIRSIAFSPNDENIISGGVDKKIKIWDLGSGKLKNESESHISDVISVAYSADGSKIISGSMDSTIKIWEAGNGKLISTIAKYNCPIKQIITTPDRLKFASIGYGDNTIKIWRSVDGELLKTIIFDHNFTSTIDFSPDGNSIASGGWGYKNIRIYNISDLNKISNGKDNRAFFLNQNYPNPFNSSTFISYTLPKNSHVRIKLFNTLGELVKIILDEYQTPGNYSVCFSPKDFSSGIYLYSLQTDNYFQVKKMIYLK